MDRGRKARLRRPIEPELADNPRIRALGEALQTASGGGHDLVLRLLRDLLSAREMQDVANRWAAARMLLDGQTQTATARGLGLSNKTVNGISQWTGGIFATGGYQDVHARLAPSDGRDYADG